MGYIKIATTVTSKDPKKSMFSVCHESRIAQFDSAVYDAVSRNAIAGNKDAVNLLWDIEYGYPWIKRGGSNG